MDFGRIVTAMATPFDEEGRIDFNRTERLVEHLLANGSDALVVAGTTGESPTLTLSEKLSLFECVVGQVRGRVKVIAGTSNNDTETSVQFSREAAKVGIDGLLLVAPYYNKPSQEGMFQHFTRIAAAVDLPVMLYNVPGRTASNLTPATVARLAQLEPFVALKEASGDLTQMTQILLETQGDLLLYSGDDKLTLPILSIGGHGVVSVASHVVGPQMQRLVHAFLHGKVDEAARLHRQLLAVFEVLFITSSPSPLKFLLNHIGVPVGSVRLPLVDPSADEKEQIVQTFTQLLKTSA